MSKRKYIRDGRAPIPKSEITSRTMSAIKGKNTIIELLVRKSLWKIGHRGYRINWKKAPGNPDICFPRKKIAIFVNGCFWHRCPHCNPHIPKTHTKYWIAKFMKNVQRDKKNQQLLRKKGWSYFILWECQLKDELDVVVGNLINEMRLIQG